MSTTSDGRIKDPQKLARMVIREGKTFVFSAMECGYAKSTAEQGQSYLIRASKQVADAFQKETESVMNEITVDKLKPLAVKRLHAEIVNPRSNQGMKAIELAGRFKETDWFVRAGEVNIGVFTQISESTFETLPEEDSGK